MMQISYHKLLLLHCFDFLVLDTFEHLEYVVVEQLEETDNSYSHSYYFGIEFVEVAAAFVVVAFGELAAVVLMELAVVVFVEFAVFVELVVVAFEKITVVVVFMELDLFEELVVLLVNCQNSFRYFTIINKKIYLNLIRIYLSISDHHLYYI